MYQEVENWKQSKLERELQEKIAREFKLFDNSEKLVSEYDKLSFDKWLNDLSKKNGITKY